MLVEVRGADAGALTPLYEASRLGWLFQVSELLLQMFPGMRGCNQNWDVKPDFSYKFR